ncbi:hypothetical protein H6P81_004037 [Aristolochia fimbriata]|uniref:Uncharacterized protein n=1 Tax=Aristolochia fimbriata TaxID=158543 RepID=A0AAV7FHP6_ARIFI|nr:hypothetical protein H6P81_004036 [Aristolochia fimbriata]KAG9459529.1 hypothetical protein H6P81_004037 [Aristolochia fimbriata]
MEASNEGGTKNTLNVEYVTLGDNPLTEAELAQVVGGVPGLAQAMEGYLVANPDAPMEADMQGRRDGTGS